jgi:hypothetical protein
VTSNAEPKSRHYIHIMAWQGNCSEESLGSNSEKWANMENHVKVTRLKKVISLLLVSVAILINQSLVYAQDPPPEDGGKWLDCSSAISPSSATSFRLYFIEVIVNKVTLFRNTQPINVVVPQGSPLLASGAPIPPENLVMRAVLMENEQNGKPTRFLVKDKGEGFKKKAIVYPQGKIFFFKDDFEESPTGQNLVAGWLQIHGTQKIRVYCR